MTRKGEEFIWALKYRPRTINECVLPTRIKSIFNDYVAKEQIPHFILAGTPGVGKTTVGLALCDELGVESIIINGSLERNIDVLRTTIMNFATTKSLTGKFKVVIIDEADHLSPLVMAAFRNILESFASNCRFIFTCNYPDKIIDAIQSRCQRIDFMIERSEMADIAKNFFNLAQGILDKEGIKYDNAAVAAVIKQSFPDFRKTLNNLQKVAQSGEISAETIAVRSSIDIDKVVPFVKGKEFANYRKWVSNALAVEDSHGIFRKFYDQALEYVTPASVPNLVLLIASYMDMSTRTPDPEINLTAFLTDCAMNLEFR